MPLESDVYTVWIDFMSIQDYNTRTKQAIKTILLPYEYVSELKTEFASWKVNNIFEKPVHKVYFILDHFILWPYYCIKAIFVGVVSKKRWRAEKGMAALPTIYLRPGIGIQFSPKNSRIPAE